MAKLIGKVQSDRRGNSIADRIHFTALFDAIPTIEEVGNAQTKAGYHPSGYDGPWGINTTADGVNFTVTWTCSASCD